MIIKSSLDFKKYLDSKPNFKALLFLGDEPELIIQNLNRAINYLDADVTPFDGGDFDVLDVIESLTTISLFGGKRVVVIKALPLAAETLKKLISALDNLDDDSILIMTIANGQITRKWDRPSIDCVEGATNNNFIKAISNIGAVVVLDRPSNFELRNIVVKLVKNEKRNILNEDAEYLISHCGNDLGVLKNEIIKLCYYINENETITKETIDKVCSIALEDEIFKISENIIKGNAQRALKLTKDLIEQKTVPTSMVSILGTKFSKSYKLYIYKENKASKEEIMSDFKMRTDYPYRQEMEFISNVNKQQLAQICNLFYETEAKLKSKPYDDEIILEKVIVEASLIAKGARQ